MSALPALNEFELSVLELIRSGKISEDDIKAFKKIWANYFLMKATNKADKAWKEKKYSAETIKKWIKGEE